MKLSAARLAVTDDLALADLHTDAAFNAMEVKAFAIGDTLAMGQLLEAQRITEAASASLRAIADRLGFK